VTESYGEREYRQQVEEGTRHRDKWEGVYIYTIPSTMTIWRNQTTLPYEKKRKYIKYDHMG
jgi:hypothetical protein